MSKTHEAERLQFSYFFPEQEDLTPIHGPNASDFNLSQVNGRLFDPSKNDPKLCFRMDSTSGAGT